MIRCVRYAFANIPASIGAIFFSKHVALPFIRFRMLRHGYLKSPLHYSKVSNAAMRGIWIIGDPRAAPDLIVFYAHGGGFSMGSPYFYLEFLMAWLSLLQSRQGYRNPAIFGLEYTLVPTASFPTQLRECKAGYDFALSKLPDGNPLRVCLAGDSAGATLIMSLLLSQAQENVNGEKCRKAAGFVTMISPWCKLLSDKNEDTTSDYLNANSLRLYARQYVGGQSDFGQAASGYPRETKIDVKPVINYQLASPGNCESQELWDALPAMGFHFIYGSDEVFAVETEKCIEMIKTAGRKVHVTNEPGIHAWPIVNLFLGNTVEERLKGLDRIVDVMGRHMII